MIPFSLKETTLFPFASMDFFIIIVSVPQAQNRLEYEIEFFFIIQEYSANVKTSLEEYKKKKSGLFTHGFFVKSLVFSLVLWYSYPKRRIIFLKVV